MDQHLANATSTALLHQLRDLWNSPRRSVVRIEALALVAIILSFILAAFGSCRRWSNRWVVQKGFWAAQVLSLSLGTYSIGLMQSSSVKSEMYPIWTVSLITLFGCVDPVTTYVGLDFMGPLLKVISQLCLYCGYVLLMTVSTGSGVVGNKFEVIVLCTITFVKVFYRSLALVLPNVRRYELGFVAASAEPSAFAGDSGSELQLTKGGRHSNRTTMACIYRALNGLQDDLCLKVTAKDKTIIEDVCLGFSLSELLRKHFLGLGSTTQMESKRENFESLVGNGRVIIDYKRALKVVEIELAFLYEMFYTSNEFLHYHEANLSSFWALVSFIGICFVGVATAIPSTMTGSHHIASTKPGAGNIVTSPTKADHITTLVILVSLAVLQLVQLIRCWTSNWARVAFAFECADKQESQSSRPTSSWRQWMRLRAFVATRMNWFDKYLWQDKLGQYSLLGIPKLRFIRMARYMCFNIFPRALFYGQRCRIFRYRLGQMLGLEYIGRVLGELLRRDNKGEAAVCLHEDVKAKIIDFLSQIKSRRIGKDWSSLFVNNGLDPSDLPYNHHAPLHKLGGTTVLNVEAFMRSIMMWHIATCYCEVAEQEGSAEGGQDREKNRRVAIHLSKYCAYLVVSVPELLLPARPTERERVIGEAIFWTWDNIRYSKHKNVAAMLRHRSSAGYNNEAPGDKDDVFRMGVYWGKRLRNETQQPPGSTRRCCSDPWEVLALLWVQTLLYAAPYGDVQTHMQRLSQGGEFITHLWALLYHLGIDKWEREEEISREKEIVEQEAVETRTSRGCNGRRLSRARSLPAILVGSKMQSSSS